MKTVVRIFGILIVVISLVTCSLSIYRAQLDKEDVVTEMTEVNAQVAKYKEQISTTSGEMKTMLEQELAKVEKVIASQPSASTYLIVQIFLTVLLALALTFAVFLFRPNLKLTTQLLGAAVIITVLTYFMSPDIERGPYGGMESRTAALISGIPVVIAGLFALLIAKRNTAK
jgi:uncharacterized membrane protein